MPGGTQGCPPPETVPLLCTGGLRARAQFTEDQGLLLLRFPRKDGWRGAQYSVCSVSRRSLRSAVNNEFLLMWSFCTPEAEGTSHSAEVGLQLVLHLRGCRRQTSVQLGRGG